MRSLRTLALAGMFLVPGRGGQGVDPLARCNELFHAAYGEAKAARLDQGGPVLLVAGDRLTLYRGRTPVAQERIQPERYHRLKAVAHVPLALQVLLDGAREHPAEDLRALHGYLGAARAELPSWCAGPVLVRQERILDASLGLLEARLGAGRLDPGRMEAFATGLGPLLGANADLAAELELEQLHGKVRGLLRGLDPAQRGALRVVISGSHMARDGELTLQYFTRLLGEVGEGDRVIYAEGLWQPEQALDLLATHLVDRGLGAAFFGDPARMHRDVLADGARRWLSALPPPSLTRPRSVH